MLEPLGNTILHDAANLLRTQKKVGPEEKFSASFDELFRIDNSENINKYSDYNDDFVIDLVIREDLASKNYQDVYNEKAQEDIANNSKEESKTNVESENSISAKTTDDMDQTDKTGKIADKVEKDIRKISVLKLKAKDVDFKTRQKINVVLSDYRAGKINEETANRYISQILKNSNLKSLSGFDESKLIGAKIGEKQKSSNKSEIAKSSNGILKNEALQKNEVSNAFSMKNVNNKINKNKILKESKKLSEGLNKELKTEVKLEMPANKTFNMIQDTEISVEPKQILESNKKSLFQQIAKNTKIILSQNQTKFSTMVRPENVGRLDFKFVVKDGKMNGRIIVQNQETADFFKSNVEELRAVFQKSNVELENIDILLAGNRFGQGNNDPNNGFVNEDNSFFEKSFSTKNFDRYENNVFAGNINYSKSARSLVDVLV